MRGQVATRKRRRQYNDERFVVQQDVVLGGQPASPARTGFSRVLTLLQPTRPFNKGVKAFEGTTKAGKNVSYKDVWHWGDVQDAWTEEIKKKHPSLFNVIQYANAAAGDDMGAFLCWMGVRVIGDAPGIERYRQYLSPLRPNSISLPKSNARCYLWSQELSE